MPSISEEAHTNLLAAERQLRGIRDLLAQAGFASWSETVEQRVQTVLRIAREERRNAAALKAREREHVRERDELLQLLRHREAGAYLTRILTPLGFVGMMARPDESVDSLVRRALIARLTDLLAARALA